MENSQCIFIDENKILIFHGYIKYPEGTTTTTTKISGISLYPRDAVLDPGYIEKHWVA